ncbi:NmrA family protein [Syntrophobacter sp. SbD1]|nr:NmrA family protein [Syntrophobacter sp. SbD1]
MKILVTGGTGTVGSRLIDELLKLGADVRALVRNKASTKIPKGVETVLGDLLDPVSVHKALEKVDKLYLLNGVVPDELTQGLIALGLARRQKIQHIVYHSVFKVQEFKDVPHFASKLAIETALHESGLPFTIIRPGYFFQNDLGLKDAITRGGMYPMPLGDAGISAVDVRDIAEATAIVLTGSGHIGKTYDLVGPDTLSGNNAAAIWSKLLGKKVRYTGHDMDAFEAEMRKKAPSWAAFDIRMMFQRFLERGFTANNSDLEPVRKLLGHSLRRYEDFAREAAAAWASELKKAA